MYELVTIVRGKSISLNERQQLIGKYLVCLLHISKFIKLTGSLMNHAVILLHFIPHVMVPAAPPFTISEEDLHQTQTLEFFTFKKSIALVRF
jgi:hypothetical protein